MSKICGTPSVNHAFYVDGNSTHKFNTQIHHRVIRASPSYKLVFNHRIYIPGSSRCSLFPPLITEAKIIASNSGKRLWFEKMPLLLLGLPFKSKRHYTSELGSKPEVVISLSRIGESPYFVCRIRQDDSPVYLYHDQNLNHNMNNLKQHLLHVVNII